MRSALERTRHQLLSVEPLESDRKTARPQASHRFRATIYDHTNGGGIVPLEQLATT